MSGNLNWKNPPARSVVGTAAGCAGVCSCAGAAGALHRYLRDQVRRFRLTRHQRLQLFLLVQRYFFTVPVTGDGISSTDLSFLYF